MNLDGPLASDEAPHDRSARLLPGRAGEQSFGLMRIAGALLALPVQAIREVIPGQAAYRPMPMKAEGLRGAVNLRGTVIPVLDLRQTLGLAAAAAGDHVVVILRLDGRLIGLVADEVCGIARLQSEDIFTLTIANGTPGAQLSTHTFQSGEEVVTVLDPQAITTIHNVPMVPEPPRSARTRMADSSESVLLFTCGRSRLGIDATWVDATVPNMRFERNALATGNCLGVIDHHGFEVPVVQTTDAIGLGAGRAPVEASVIVVRFAADAMIALAIDEVHDIARIAASDILPMPMLSTEGTSLFRGMIADANGRQHLLLNADSLRADARLSALARLRKPKLSVQRGEGLRGADPKAALKPAEKTEPFLTYRAGAERATLLTQVSAILTLPTDIVPFEAPGRTMLGLFNHRGRVAPLVCLGTLLGKPCDLDPAGARVLVVEDGGDIIGFVVEALRSIETATWHSPPVGKAAAEQALLKTLVLVGVGDQRRMLSHVDLTTQARGFFVRREAAETFTAPRVGAWA